MENTRIISNIKYSKVKTMAEAGKYHLLYDYLVSRIPIEIWETCSVRNISLLIDAMNGVRLDGIEKGYKEWEEIN